MEEQYQFTTTEEERAQRRAQRIAQRRKRQREERIAMLRRVIPAGAVLLVLLAVILLWPSENEEETKTPPAANATEITLSEEPTPDPQPESEPEPIPEPEEPEYYGVKRTAETVQLGEELDSDYIILIDLQTDTVIAEKAGDAVISPASMTKILTLLTAVEAIEERGLSLEDTVPITYEITDYCYVNDCSVAGFLRDEEVPVRDLLYGTILPSGAEAAMGLAIYVAGSQDEFVKLMNEKVEELGLSETAHFTNCIGLYNEQNVCTVYDMAMILKAAMENETCRQVLGTKIYEIPPSDLHPEGMILSNWFIRRIEDKDTGAVEVIGAKTGYVNQAGSCAASCAADAKGNEYICVTGKAISSWSCIYDHVDIYKGYVATGS